MPRMNLNQLGERIKASPLAKILQDNGQRSNMPLLNLERRLASQYEAIGSRAVEWDGTERFQDLGEALRKTQQDMTALREQMAREEAERAARAHSVCPACAHPNPLNAKFCLECGCALVHRRENRCPACGHTYGAEAKFCGECGTRLENVDVNP